MRGREFLALARELLSFGKTQRHWRAVAIHAYYALLLECREAMTRWGLPALARQQVHGQVRLRLVYATDSDLKRIGDKLEILARRRNAASYDLHALTLFSSANAARDDITMVADTLALLDAIDADPSRRAAAIAAIKP
jgi:hypothetical protein